MRYVPFYTVWQPYIEHLAIAIDLFDCNLGADDEAATHALICDRSEQKVYVASFDEVIQFLDCQHPPQQPLSSEQWEKIKMRLEKQASLTMSEMQELGMFELFVPNPKHQQKATELIAWLDQIINEP